jgi:GTP pyrophosphokinase
LYFGSISNMAKILTPEQLEQEKKEILNAYRGLIKSCQEHTSAEDRKLIRKAFEYSMEMHKDARRKSGEPYIFHPIAVARIVNKEIGLGTTSIICALLHDVVEDTFAEVEDIRREFGNTVAGIIDGLTKISGVFDHKSSQQAENFRKMLLTLSDDIRVVLIKLADRLHNMRTLDHMKREKQLKIASETHYLYAPLAHRLGLYNIKEELEDLSLKYLEPKVHKDITQQMRKYKDDQKNYIQAFIRSIREPMQAAGLQFDIKGRFKSIASIYRKMQAQEIPFDQVYDLFAVRIILYGQPENEKADCWKAYSLITEKYVPNLERLRDWITLPKSNGYESLHITVMGPKGRWVEVQIRTERMDDQAEKGFAAHWKYKDKKGFDDKAFEQWLARIHELLENPQLSALEFVDEFKSNLASEEVYVFTPKGDLKTLPAKSTVLDFAYDIHTKVGNSCIGAKINGRLVPLSYQLKNGDQVEIITSRKEEVKDEWTKYAQSSKAQKKIAEALKEQKKLVAAKGEELFNWKAKSLGLTASHEFMNVVLAHFKVKSTFEFFYQLGSHRLDIKKLQELIQLRKEEMQNKKTRVKKEGTEKVTDPKSFESFIREKRGVDTDMLVIGQDMEHIDYHFAPCCQPIPGDEIVGFILPKKGIEIHRTNCFEAEKLMSSFGPSIVKTKWTEDADITFLAGMKIIGEDRIGMMNHLIKVISLNMKINIRSITIDTEDGIYEGVFKVFVHNTQELTKVMENLKKVSGVFSVTRV